MRGRAARATGVVLCAALLGVACGPEDGRQAVTDDRPVAIADQEDAVCGMLVREQTAPRGQVLHRDGTRAFFCSIGDLLVYLGTPSPHGAARVVFVEVMQPDEDPAARHTGPHPWRVADQVAYVVGVERGGVMGAPVLVYDDVEQARTVAAAHPGARVLDFASLQQWWRDREAAR